MAYVRRFAQTTDEEIASKRLKLNADNTIQANKRSASVFRDYLREKRQDEKFEGCDEQRLDEALSHFYLDVRKPDGTKYKTNSFEGIRYGIKRYLRSPPHNKTFDIIKDPVFNDCYTDFRAVMAELKWLGLGDTDHHPVISESDRHKLYTSLYLSPKTPSGLASKVQFDIRLYFFRRGSENMHSMTKSTFEVQTDSKTGLKLVTKVKDELTKNHRQDDKENISGIMPESPGSPYCPVASFEEYVRRLHPKNESLWQKPLSSFNDDSLVWFCNSPLGEKKMRSFMSDLSKKCKLSMNYTNHSIRATGATILSKNIYCPAQIMSVTGHKSVQSLSVYQRVGQDEKINMGRTLFENIVSHSNQSALPSTQKLALRLPPVQTHGSCACQYRKSVCFAIPTWPYLACTRTVFC